MTNAEIKPCPFCGCAPDYKVDDGVWREHHSVLCINTKCQACVVGKVRTHATKDAAITAWNTHAPDASTLQKENEELHGQVKLLRLALKAMIDSAMDNKCGLRIADEAPQETVPKDE